MLPTVKISRGVRGQKDTDESSKTNLFAKIGQRIISRARGIILSLFMLLA